MWLSLSADTWCCLTAQWRLISAERVAAIARYKLLHSPLWSILWSQGHTPSFSSCLDVLLFHLSTWSKQRWWVGHKTWLHSVEVRVAEENYVIQNINHRWSYIYLLSNSCLQLRESNVIISYCVITSSKTSWELWFRPGGRTCKALNVKLCKMLYVTKTPKKTLRSPALQSYKYISLFYSIISNNTSRLTLCKLL